MEEAAVLASYIVYGLLHQPEHADTQAASLARGSVGYAWSGPQN